MRISARNMAIVPIVSAMAICIPGITPAYADPKDDLRRVNSQLAQANAVLEGATERARSAAQAYVAATVALPEATAAIARTKGQAAAAAALAAHAKAEADT